MPRLDRRLRMVAAQIRSRIHADVGSDHGHLLKALLKSGRIEQGIAIENKETPLQNSRMTLAGLNAEVRFADGLEGLREGEVDSLSICGMGAASIVRVLNAFPERIPARIVLQPNNHPEIIREWGIKARSHLIDERLTTGKRSFLVMCFGRLGNESDAAYEGLDREAAVLFGPHFIRRRNPQFVERLRQERDYLKGLEGLETFASRKLAAIERILSGPAIM